MRDHCRQSISRREIAECTGSILTALAALAALTSAATAQDYPNRPIRFIHGFPPGGNVDIIARLLGAEMSKGLGQPIVVEAKPGVAGSLAAEFVARSEPDGYTLLVVPSAHPAHGGLAKNVRYRVVDDFQWISVASFYPFLICVRADSRFKTLTQLIDEARKNPGGLKYGSAGVGSILHTTIELLANQTKTKFLHIPYRGEVAAITGLLQGDVDIVAVTDRADHHAHPRRRVPRARRHQHGALARPRRCADRRRAGRPGLRGDLVDRHGRAGQAAGADLCNGSTPNCAGIARARRRRSGWKGWAAIRARTTPDEMRDLVARQLATWSTLAKEANIAIE